MIALGKETELLKIREVDVHGLGRAEQAAGFSMQADVGLLGKVSEQDVSRGKRLGNTKSGGGEDKFLRFITVEFTVTAPRYWYQELMTYHHLEMNSQSTMHRITNMDIEKACNPYVDAVVIENLQKLIDSYKAADEDNKKAIFKRIKANIPEGLMLTARVVTNYAQLKTIYRQRSKHRLAEWSECFCPWIESLPMASEYGLTKGNDCKCMCGQKKPSKTGKRNLAYTPS